MSALDKLVGQVLLEVARAPENTGFRFSSANLGVFSTLTGSPPEALIGRLVTGVRQVEGESMEIQFTVSGRLCIDLSGPGPESYSLHFSNGPIVVG